MHGFMRLVLVLLVLLALLCVVFSPGFSQEAPKVDPPKPFLSLPLKTGTKFTVTEGWIYSEEERNVHGFHTHFGIDLACERGAPILAPADGLALASYHLAYPGRDYQGKRVGFGLGKFVQIWHPEHGVYTMLAHLDKVSEAVPYFEPIRRGEGWDPTVVYQPVATIMKLAKSVKRGEIIGYAGDTGSPWGYEETPTFRPDPNLYPSWDRDLNVHMEVYNRGENGQKKDRWDPFGIYGLNERYKDLPAQGLWLTEDGKIRFADAK